MSSERRAYIVTILQSITSTWVLKLHSTNQNSGSPPSFFLRKAIILRTTQIAQTVRHIGSPILPHMPLKTLDKTLSLQYSFYREHPVSQTNSKNAIWADGTRHWCHILNMAGNELIFVPLVIFTALKNPLDRLTIKTIWSNNKNKIEKN